MTLFLSLLFFVFLYNNVMPQQFEFHRHYHIKKDVFEAMPNDEGEIIFLGNSITAGVEWAELFDNDRIKNRGISGDITAGILNRLDEITESKPDMVFIMIGTNDLSKGITIDSILINYNQILKRIVQESPNTEIFIQSVLPVNDEFDYFKNHTDKGDSILVLNKELKELAAQKGINYIDLHSKFSNEKGKLKKEFTFDGLHLNGSAYLTWKEILNDIVGDL
jgi:lysophospholipase L1-like esterase